MLCPNCHSDDVITVQDQLICVNCGRLLTRAEAAAQKKKAEATPIVKVLKKGKPGRPRAAKLDTPVMKAAPRPVADVKAPVVRAVAQAAPEPVLDELAHGSVVLGGLRALRPTWIVLGLPGAVLVTSSIAYAFSTYTYMPRSEQAPAFVVSLAVFITGVVWLRFIRSAVMFQRAGVHDHRLSGFGTALRVAASRSSDLALLNLRHLAALLGEVSLLALVIWYGGHITFLPSIVHLILVFLACFILLYLIASLWVVQRLIEAGMIISRLSLTAAHWLGWRLWRRHWELLGARVGGLIVALVVVGGVGIGLEMALSSVSYLLQVATAVAAGSLAVAMLTVVSGGAAEASYRQLVAMSQPRRASRLLGKRQAQRPSLGARLVLLSALLLPLAAAAIVGLLWH